MGYLFWAILAIIFGVIEIIVPALVTIWFALAAGLVSIISCFITNIYIEVSLFVVTSIIFLMFTRSIVRKYIKKDNPIYSSDMIGDEVLVVKKIKDKQYDVKFKGAIWTAFGEDEFEINEIAKIKYFSGNRIFLEKISK